MYLGDRYYCPQNGVQVTTGQRVYERILFDSAVALGLTLVSANGAAAASAVKLYATNMDPINSPPQVDANAVSTMISFFTGSLTANTNANFIWTLYGNNQLACRYLFLDVNFTAGGTFWLYVNVRRLQA